MDDLAQFLFFECIMENEESKEELLDMIENIVEMVDANEVLPEEVKEKIYTLCESCSVYDTKEELEDVISEIEDLIEIYEN